MLRLVASVEVGSEHPLATAIVVGARERGLPLADARQFEAIAGHGIRAVVEDKTLLVGNRKQMDDNGVAVDTIEAQAAALIVLMKSDPLDIIRAITLSKATVRKMRQNLFWAAIYNVLAIPVAAGALYPAFGIELRPEWSALLMSLSSNIVAVNAVLLWRVERELNDSGTGIAPAAPTVQSAPTALRGERPTHITAEEHTAQLSQRDRGRVYATTKEFELRFQDIALSDKKPPVDVLSCTTTMEVGIDIGSLVAIGMRNVPPQRENYQQRAGRAGRRGSAVSTVVTYADNGAHDHFYYHSPEGMISGATRRPQLKLDSRRIAQRHLGAYLLQTFFHSQLDRLAPHERSRIAAERKHLATALGILEEFYNSTGTLSFSGFRAWVRANVGERGEITRWAATWLPDELFGTSPEGVSLDQLKRAFITETAAGLVVDLERIATSRQAPTPQEQGQPVEEVERSGERELASGLLLDTLFDEGLLPSYAFPTDLVSFYVFGTEGERVVIKERPQQSKMRALSEYAPGRLLVVNKETYRVGGIFVEGAGYRDPAARLFAKPLATYVSCPCCTYVRLEPLRGQERCPVCASALEQRAMLDPPGFAPEGGRPLDERDRDQDISYASGAQLPTPLSSDEIEWHSGGREGLSYAYAQNRQLVTINKGPSEQGFAVCTSCGAAWPFADRPKGSEHKRPYLAPGSNRWGGGRCRGEIYASPIYLGSTFRTDVLVLRLTLRRPIGYDPRHQWLHDALQTTAEALVLAASRTLDVDPAELSAGYRLMPPVDEDPDALASVDFYLFDTASGGAGYAAEAGEELPAILAAALDLVEQCPRNCERSCTRCMRHYGNRFFHNRLDRHLASAVLRYAIDGEVPASAPTTTQRQQLASLSRYLELEGWQEAESPWKNGSEAPLLLLSPIRHGQSRQLVAVARDLPTAYQQFRRKAGVL